MVEGLRKNCGRYKNSQTKYTPLDITRIQKHLFCFLVVELMKPPSEQKKRKKLIVLEELLQCAIYFCLCFNMERKTDIRKERQTVVFIIIDEIVRASGDYPHSGPASDVEWFYFCIGRMICVCINQMN